MKQDYLAQRGKRPVPKLQCKNNNARPTVKSHGNDVPNIQTSMVVDFMGGKNVKLIDVWYTTQYVMK